MTRTGRTTYGHVLGVLMLDTTFPRPVGDVGHAGTWPFPVLYRTVTGAATYRVVGSPEPDLLPAFVAAARELEAAGVRLITTSCGFLAAFQRELAAAVRVPVVSSALLQVPAAVHQAGGRPVAVLVNRRGALADAHMTGAGWAPGTLPVRVGVLPAGGLFARIYSRTDPEEPVPAFDAAGLERELVDAAEAAVAAEPDLGAIVLECTNHAPYAAAVRAATGLPVYDLVTSVLGAARAVAGLGG